MANSKRKLITLYVTEQLKNINGDVSTFDPTYTYSINIFNNSRRQLRFLDEVNDFPSLYLTAGTEIREFQSQGLTECFLDITIRAYVKDSNSREQIDSLLEDIEHVIYATTDNPELGILDMTIEGISTDEGLLTPFGLAEVELSIVYRL